MRRAQQLLIIGAGGFGREVHDVVIAINDAHTVPMWDFLGFVDDGTLNEELIRRRHTSFLGTTAVLASYAGASYVVAIGDPIPRRRLARIADDAGLIAGTLVHPSATMGLDVEIGGGSIICSHVSITTHVRIGRHVHLDQNVAIGHDAVLNDYARVNPGATVSGNVSLDEGVTMGTNSAVIEGLTIGRGTVVGAGAAVVHDLPSGVVAVGVPARPLSCRAQP